MAVGVLAQSGSYGRVHDLDRSRSLMVRETSPVVSPRPRLFDRVRETLRTRHYSRRTEKAYVGWIRRYVLFHGKRTIGWLLPDAALREYARNDNVG